MSEERNLFSRALDTVLGARADKREWRQYKARVQALPPDYRLVMEKIQKFFWNTSGVTDGHLITVLYDICALFEEESAAGRPVLEVTGDDVAGFVENVVRESQATTWQGQKAKQLNADIHRELKGR
ncbi:MAG: DUF1048 domain-containing protein [Propionibacteriaceae bacterium]|jgi:DNA-binding ferritin-like protein (Dps family)|nr:DUF1048 domain-containing protein [Propionibacteriaceae bacterium]